MNQPQLDQFNSLSDRAFAQDLRPVRVNGALKPDDVVLICVARNEASRLPRFFAHHKQIGVSRFLIVDNGSEDETAALLLAEPMADVFHTAASFRDAVHGLHWYNGLARALCVGHWTLMADADELFVYDGMETHDLKALGLWLESHSLDRVFAPMIDLYPPGVIGETGRSVEDNLDSNSWFDTTQFALQRRPGGWLVTGGPRQRLFGQHALTNGEWASKYPFFRMRADLVINNPHFLAPPDEGPARPLAALLHLKFMDDFKERSARALRENQYHLDSKAYRAIDRKLADEPRQVARYEKSARYAGPSSLISHDLLMPIDWTAAALPSRRTLGGIDYRRWTGAESPLSLPLHEREEFEEFSRRAFDLHLVPVRAQGRLGPGEIGLLCVLRNKAARLPLFFDHYKRLGVNRFFMIDNNSQDGSRDLLLAEPSADIFYAKATYREGQDGLYWAQAIARRFGEGNWLIRADADELFVYDGLEGHGLGDLAAWLDRRAMDRVFAPLIDLYPSSRLGTSTQPVAEVMEADSWFDNDGYSLTRWPQGWRLTGGPLRRLSGEDDKLRDRMWKYPLFHMRPETLIYDHHWLWPHDTVTRGALGAIVHLRLMHEREGRPLANFFYDDSKRYRGPRSLIRHGMMMPIDWDA